MTLARRILELLYEREALAPGDAVAIIGEPRYKVLAAFQCLEELGFIERVYSRGTYKIFRLSLSGRALLEKAEAVELSTLLERVILGVEGEGDQAQASTGT